MIEVFALAGSLATQQFNALAAPREVVSVPASKLSAGFSIEPSLVAETVTAQSNLSAGLHLSYPYAALILAPPAQAEDSMAISPNETIDYKLRIITPDLQLLR